MKRNTIITLATAIGFALFQPISTFAEDQAQKDKGQAKKEKMQGKSGGKAGIREQASTRPRISPPSGRSKGGTSRSDIVSIKPSNKAGGRSRASQSVTNQTATAPSSRFAPSTPRDSQRFSSRGGSDPSFSTRGSFTRSRSSSDPSFSTRGSFTRSNNYGGRWVQGDTFPEWDRNRIHFWNQHQYRW